MHPARSILSLAAGLVVASVAGVAALPLARVAYPATPVVPVASTFFGTTIVDPYRWLEAGTAPSVVAWATAQSAVAATYLDAQPSHAFYERRMRMLAKTGAKRGGLQIVRGRYFYERSTPPQAQAVLVARDGLGGTERVLYDPNVVARDAAPEAIAAFAVAPDAAHVAFTTQAGGTEDETLHVVDAATGTLLPDVVAHAGGGTSPTAFLWEADGTAFVHTRFPLTGTAAERHANILFYRHRLGTDPASDAYVFGDGAPANAEYNVTESADGRLQAIAMTAGDGVHATISVRRGDGAFVQVASPDDVVGSSTDVGCAFVGDRLFMLSAKRDSRGEIVAVGPDETFATGTTVFREDRYAIEGVKAVPGGFITRELDGGPSVARFVGTDGTTRALVPIPDASTLTGIAADPRGGDIVVSYTSYGTPNRWLRYEPQTNALRPTGIENAVAGDYSKVVVRRAFVPALDGTAAIPIDIVALSTTHLGRTTPTAMTAYGAYGFVQRPFFIGDLLAFLERGGVLVAANIRGGGAYGEGWQKAALHETVYKRADDLAACARWLATHGYGDRRHLGMIGGSAGGYLMGLAFTRDPELYRAIVSDVGIYDTLRWVDTPNGRFNVPEFGDPRDPKQFSWMYKYGPYYNVRKGVAYPAILMETGENDPRVDPRESRKMIARLQAATASNAPVLLRQKSGEGHGIGSSLDQRVAGEVDEATFFEANLR